MTSLRDAVADGLARQGLDISEEHGAIVVRGGEGEHTVSVWVDEMDRVVRATEILCNDVDDFVPELSLALDHLNQARQNVSFTYQEAQRALVATTVWSSPLREPSPNQLHLLVALLHQAKERDAPSLAAVAQGEASWDELAAVDEDAAPSRLQISDDEVEPDWNAPDDGVGWLEDLAPGAGPDTRSLGAPLPEPEPEPPGAATYQTDGYEPARRNTGKFARPQARTAPAPAPQASWQEPAPRPEPAGAPRRPVGRLGAPQEPTGEPAARRTSRHALQRAVSTEKAEPPRVDMTVGRRSLFRRGLKWTSMFLAVGLVVAWVLNSFVLPFIDEDLDLFSWDTYFPPLAEIPDHQKDLERRQAMAPGEDLLKLELRRPLPNASFVEPCLEALGPRARSVLETFAASGESEAMRVAAYELWTDGGYGEEDGARLRLLRQICSLQPAGKSFVDEVVENISADLGRKPPSDAEAIAALTWAPPEVWRALVVQLGREGEGAEERAAALAAQLPRDDAESTVLLALIRTGHAPPDAVPSLVSKRGLEWAGDEGRELLVELAEQHPDSVLQLLEQEKEDLPLLALDLITEIGNRWAVRELLRVLRERERPLRLRMRAAISLGKLGAPETTWPLVVALSTKEEDAALKDEMQRALVKIPAAQAVEQLQAHLAPEKKLTERYYALKGLQALGAPVAINALVTLLEQDADQKLRRYTVQALSELHETGEHERTLIGHLAVFRRLARQEKDALVRKAVARFYKELTGRDP